MTAAGDYVENAVLTTYLVTKPAFAALYTSDVSDAGVGPEITGGAYARKAATFTVSNGTATLSADIVWNGMPGSTVGAVAFWDAQSAGNLLFHGALTASKTVAAGDAFALPAGNVTISVD